MGGEGEKATAGSSHLAIIPRYPEEMLLKNFFFFNLEFNTKFYFLGTFQNK